jgi:O-antigen ligase
MDMKEAAGSIEGSSNWRNELFSLSMNDWLQEPRTIATGRGGYAWTDADTFAMDKDTYTGLMVSALRRGATHNLFTDLVVTIGIVGFLLYCATYVSLLWGVNRIRKLAERTSEIYDWSLMALIYLPVTFLIALLGGGFFSDFSGLFIAICIFLCSNRSIRKQLLRS